MTCPACQRRVSVVDLFCGFCRTRLDAGLPGPVPPASRPALPPPPAAPAAPAGDLPAARPAGVWIRAGAAAADLLLLAAWLGLVWSSLVGVTLAGAVGAWDEMALLVAAERSDDLAPVVVAAFAGVALAYLMAFLVFEGATPGKMLFRLRVVSVDGGALGVPRAFLREALGRLAVAVTLGTGFAAAAVHSERRGLHDWLGRTRVVRLP